MDNIRKHIDRLEELKGEILCDPDTDDLLTSMQRQNYLSSLDFINLAIRQLRIIEIGRGNQ